ncbi:MAG: helicase-related protein, partial [Bacteroidota bacterium]
GFPGRRLHQVALQSEFLADVWQERMRQEFERDASGSKKRVRLNFSDDPRLAWLLGFLEEVEPAKVLLICRTKAKVLAIEKALQDKSGMSIGLFHEDLSIVQRDRNAAWFAEKDGARLLICSEIGSEGRNFQFAHHLVLFDVPVQPELLEQRIGRLDRIGQTEDIQIHVPFAAGSPQEKLVRWYHEGLNAFEENLIGGNQIGRHFGPQLLRVLGDDRSDGKDFEQLLEETREFLEKRKNMLAKGRDRLLEMNSFRPKIAADLVKKIEAEDHDTGLETYLTRVFTQFGVEMEDLAPRSYLLHAPRGREPFPGVPDEGASVTFDRNRALSREDIQFLSWDHPMLTGAIDLVLGSSTGSASYGVLRGGQDAGIVLEAIFLLESSGGQTLNIDRFLSPKPLRVVVNHRGEDVSETLTADTFDHRLIPGFLDELPGYEAILESFVPDMIDAATNIAEDLADTEIMRSLRAMDQTLDHEIDRLEALQKKNDNIRPDEIEAARAEQQALSDLIRKAKIRLDALMLVKVE